MARYLAAAAVLLLPGCYESFLLGAPHGRASSTAMWSPRLNPGQRRRQPLRVLASSSDATMEKQDSSDSADAPHYTPIDTKMYQEDPTDSSAKAVAPFDPVQASMKTEHQDPPERSSSADAAAVAPYSPVHANAEQPDSSDSGDAVAYTPRVLWWTKSREEETRTLNLGLNAGFLAGVFLITAAMILGVDSDVSRGWTAGEVFLRVPLDNWAGYTDSLRANPVLVKAYTSGTVYALGDWVAQAVEGIELADIKRGRVLRSALAGLLLHGPLSHVWYDVCEGLFDTVGWNDYWWVPVPKVITDQLFWGPLWNAIYITVTGALKRDSFETIKEAVTSTAIPLVLAGIRLWPLAHLVTYGLIPTENRVLWVDAVEIVWVTILSKQAAEKAAEQEAEAEGKP